MGLDGDLFENAITAMKNDRGVASDTDLTAEDLRNSSTSSRVFFTDNVSVAEYPSLSVDGVAQFPRIPMVQLRLAIEAVFGSWNNPRAPLYRKQNKIADDLGTAVNVQAMVFGNKGETSRDRASPSRAIPPTARRNSTATIWSTPRARTSSPAFATPAPLPI